MLRALNLQLDTPLELTDSLSSLPLPEATKEMMVRARPLRLVL